MVLFCIGRRELLSAQFNDILDRMAVTYYLRFGTNEEVSLISQVQSHTEALLILGLVLAVLLGLSLNSREERVFLSMLVCVPAALLCLLVNGLVPAWIMLCLSLFAALLFCTGRIQERDGNLGRSFFVLFLPAAFLLCGLLLFKGPENYDYTRQPKSLTALAQDLSGSLSALFQPSEGETLPVSVLFPTENGTAPIGDSRQSDGAGRLDASAITEEEQLQDVLLRLTAERGGQLYLRRCSFGSYTGTGWGTAPEYPVGSVLNFAARAVENSGLAETEEIRIELVGDDTGLMYLPYYTGSDFDSDAGIQSSERSYSLTRMVYEGSYRALALPRELRDAELSYRQFVYSNYLALPESSKAALLAIAGENALQTGDVLESVSRVAEFVRGSAAYNIHTQPYPSEDYAVYLLTEGTEGYCVHFATAAAAMYRALGIPARLVTGILAEAVAGTPVEVRRLNEHAWVEVYIDGTGWLPVEVTPGSADGSGEGSSGQSAEPALPGGEDSQPTPEPLPSSAVENGGGASGSNSTERETATEPSPGSGESAPLLLILPILLLLLAIPALWYLVRRRWWKRQLSGERNQAAIAIWRCARRLCSFGGEMPPVIAQTAQRAFYGRGLAGDHELDAPRQALEQLREDIYRSLPWYKKLIFQYLHGLK